MQLPKEKARQRWTTASQQYRVVADRARSPHPRRSADHVGRFIYGKPATGSSIDLDDRTLAHLRIVIMNKLRRSESFMFDVEVGDGSGRRSFWMSPCVAIEFHFFGSRTPLINRVWIEELMQIASGPNGLTIGSEPTE